MGAMTSTPPSVLTPERKGERNVCGRLAVLERVGVQRGAKDDLRVGHFLTFAKLN